MTYHDAKAYEGKESYIFISYSHRDEKKVGRIIERLQRDGYRVWYDEGIEIGNEWPESIANHLNDSALFMAFISDEYGASNNCKRELHFAVRKKKPMISVMLEDAVLSPGLEMQLSAVQAVTYHETDEEAFFKRLYQSELVSPCRAVALPPMTYAAESPANVAVNSPATSPVYGTAKPAVAAANAMPAQASGSMAKPLAQPPVQTAPRKGAKKKKIVSAAVAILLAGVLIAVVVILVTKSPGGGTKETASKQTVMIANQTVGSLVEEVSVDLEGKEFSAEDAEVVSSLVNLRRLEIRNGSVPAQTLSAVNWEKLGGKLRYLTLENCQLTNDALQAIDFSKTENLYELRLSGNGALSDISVLRNVASLNMLDVSNTSVRDLSPLSELKNFGRLAARENGIESLAGVGEFENLKRLYLDGNALENLDGLEHAIHLEVLSASGNKISSVAALSNCNLLEAVNLCDNKIGSVEALAPSGATLQHLYLNRNEITELDVFSDLGNLERLSIDENRLTSLAPLASARKLKCLSARQNRISQMPPASLYQSLTHLYLSDNEISGEVEISGSLDRVKLHNNRITALKCEGGEYLVTVYGNPIERFSVGTENVYFLFLSYAEALEEELDPDSIRVLYLLDCPYDRRTFLEERMGTIFFSDVEEMTEKIEKESGDIMQTSEFAY